MNSQHDISHKQYKNKAHEYLNSHVHQQGIELKKIIEQVKLFSQAPYVLDLGCGGGHVSYTVAPFVDQVMAYDLSQEMLDIVSNTAIEKSLFNIQVQQGTAENLNFSDNTFDMVITRFSAHHWHQVNQAMKEIYRVLKPYGKVIIVDTVSTAQNVLDTFLQSIEMIRDCSHVRDYTVSEWVSYAEDAQLNLTLIEKQKLDLDLMSWVKRMKTPSMAIDTIKYLQQGVSQDVSTYYQIQADGSFTIDVMYMVLEKN